MDTTHEEGAIFTLCCIILLAIVLFAPWSWFFAAVGLWIFIGIVWFCIGIYDQGYLRGKDLVSIFFCLLVGLPITVDMLFARLGYGRTEERKNYKKNSRTMYSGNVVLRPHHENLRTKK